MDKYLASVKLNEIYDDNCIINKELSNKEFILKMLKNTSIPFYFFDEFLNWIWQKNIYMMKVQYSH